MKIAAWGCNIRAGLHGRAQSQYLPKTDSILQHERTHEEF